MNHRLAIVLVMLAAGCDSWSTPPSHDIETKRDLTHIGLQYHNFQDSENRPPAEEQELIDYQESAAEFLPGNRQTQDRTRAALETGQYVVVWAASVLGSTGNPVLAWHTEVPEKGGYVCRLNGLTEMMTAEEFAAAPRANVTPQSGSNESQHDLTAIVLNYHDFQHSHARPPADRQELLDYQVNKAEVPPVFHQSVKQSQDRMRTALASGQYVVVWGARIAESQENPVFAWHQDVPEQGGFISRLDRTVEMMTAEEFAAAPRATGSSPRKRKVILRRRAATALKPSSTQRESQRARQRTRSVFPRERHRCHAKTCTQAAARLVIVVTSG